MTLAIRIENTNKGNNKSALIVTRDRIGDVVTETNRQTLKEGESVTVYATDSRSFEVSEIEEAQTAPAATPSSEGDGTDNDDSGNDDEDGAE